MTSLTIRLSTMDDMKARFVAAGNSALSGNATEATPSIEFSSYDDLHRILAPLRLNIVRSLVGQGPLAIREVARRVGRDVQAVHRDVTTLVNAGIIDRHESGVTFPYDNIHFEFNMQAGKAA